MAASMHNCSQSWTKDSDMKMKLLLLMVDMNDKVGRDNIDREREIGPRGIGDMNENGEMPADFCAVSCLAID